MGGFLEGVAEGEEMIAINHRVPQRPAWWSPSKWHSKGCAHARRESERESATALETDAHVQAV